MEDKITGVFAEPIAKIIFNEPAESLLIARWGSEFSIDIPITIRFNERSDKHKDLRPYLSGLWGEVYVLDNSRQSHLIGKVAQLDFKQDFRPGYDQVSRITWRGHIGNLALFEKLRNGRSPQVSLSVWGDMFYEVKVKHELAVEFVSRGKTFWLSTIFEISKEIWIDRLRSIGILENVLVEIPLSSAPPQPWDGVWQALADARDALEKGGSTGWQACVRSCRLALEHWQKIEPEDQGPGWKPPSRSEKESRTKQQRIDSIRWHVYQLAHDSAHSHADKWERDDAVLLLSTVASLLAQRKL